MKPYLIYNDGHSSTALWGGPGADRPPTSSPPIQSLIGGVEFRVYNNATTTGVSPLSLLSMSGSQKELESLQAIARIVCRAGRIAAQAKTRLCCCSLSVSAHLLQKPRSRCLAATEG